MAGEDSCMYNKVEAEVVEGLFEPKVQHNCCRDCMLRFVGKAGGRKVALPRSGELKLEIHLGLVLEKD